MEEAKKELKQLLFEKKKSYSRYVGDVHRPNISKIKAKELENLKERLHHPIRMTQKVSPGTSLPLLPPVQRNTSFSNQLLSGIKNRQSFRSHSEAKRPDSTIVGGRRKELLK